MQIFKRQHEKDTISSKLEDFTINSTIIEEVNEKSRPVERVMLLFFAAAALHCACGRRRGPHCASLDLLYSESVEIFHCKS